MSDALVKLTEHDSLSRETVRRRLAENDLKPWQKKMWCIPKLDADYVARMEDVLDLYAEAHDPKRPVVCFDESPTQIIAEVLADQPVRLSSLAQGVPIGGELDYLDEGTLSAAMRARTRL